MGNWGERKSSRRGRDGRDRLPPFVALTWDLLNSQAYKKLPPSATKALPYFLGKVKVKYHDPQKYIEEFKFSYTEGRRDGFALGTFSKVIHDLIRFGFIDPVAKAKPGRYGKGENVFKLSRRWEQYGRERFEEVEPWKKFLP